MTFFTKSGSSLNVPNISWAIVLKILQFLNNLRCRTFHAWNISKNCLAWAERYVNIISNLSNCDSTIIQNHFLYCFNVFIGCWRARATSTSIVIDIFLALLKPVISQLNLYSAYSRLATINIIFYTKHNTGFFDPFFRIVKNRKAHQTMPIIFIFQKFLAKTVRVNKPAVKKFLKNLLFGVDVKL